jgi:hypothetical protein
VGLKEPGELTVRAQAAAEGIARAALGSPVRVQVDVSGQEWHQTLLRHIFEQRMSVWTPFAALDVIVGAKGEVLGYIDHEAYRRADEVSALDDEEMHALIVDDELLPPRTRIIARTAYSGPDGGRILAATVEGGEGRRWLVEINCARRLVAAIRPLASGSSV